MAEDPGQRRGTRIAKMHPHMLRHTFVTTMVDAGISLRDVQFAARHADPRTTVRHDRSGKTSTDIPTRTRRLPGIGHVAGLAPGTADAKDHAE
jgi:integrase